MLARRSLGWPITLAVVMIVLLVVMTIGWILVNVVGWQITNRAVFVAILAVGTTFLVLVLVGVVLYLLISIKEIRLNQRQSNFIDSVTHELKSPIASLKLYLQTLARHKLSEQQQADFHRFMLEDVERLDRLIDHLLDAARLDHRPMASEVEQVPLQEMLRRCAETVCQRYQLPLDVIQLDLAPVMIDARPMDVEIVFRNLLDNAVKYSGQSPQVRVESGLGAQGLVVTRVIDNGPGISPKLRWKIFSRFVRLGSELERSQTGTGLGLYIVRSLVKRMRGKISVRDREGQPGTIFEVQIPGQVTKQKSVCVSGDRTAGPDPAVPPPAASDGSG